MKKTLLSTMVAGSILASSIGAAHADEGQFFTSLAFGNVEHSVSVDGVKVTNESADELSLELGWQFSDRLSVGFTHKDLGSAEIYHAAYEIDGERYIDSINNDMSAMGIFVEYELDNDSTGINYGARIGVASMDNSLRMSEKNISTGESYSESVSDKATKPFYGLFIGYNFTEDFQIKLRGERFTHNSNYGGEEDIEINMDNISIALTYAF